MSVSIIRREADAFVARWDEPALGIVGELVYLTGCCQAAVTGVCVTPVTPDGIACKGCYRPVNPRLAGTPDR